MPNNKQKVSPLVLVLLIAVILLGISVWYLNSYKSTTIPTDAEISGMFDCNRITMEVRSTDGYCEDPQSYRDEQKEKNSKIRL